VLIRQHGAQRQLHPSESERLGLLAATPRMTATGRTAVASIQSTERVALARPAVGADADMRLVDDSTTRERTDVS
jgi:hypothetical protein